MARYIPSRLGGMSQSSDIYYSVVAAIDLGTSSSGYAFAVRRDPQHVLNSSDIHLNKWQIGTASSFTDKTPTTVLLKPDKTFDCFGYKAEDAYAKLCATNKQRGWWFFEKFKMALYETKTLSREAQLVDKEGKRMPAVKVFAIVIAHLKEQLLRDVRKQTADKHDNDVLYILTVPAIWSDAAKQLMREAATSKEVDLDMAGVSRKRSFGVLCVDVSVDIPADQLTLVLEPEAASVHCRHVVARGERRLDRSQLLKALPVGHTYTLVDLGGGTADIATHKIIGDDLLQEIACARGDDLGGEKFNQKFLEFLEELFGIGDIFERWMREEIGDLMKLQRSIEGLKWDVSSNPGDEILLEVPQSLSEMLREIGHTLESVINQSRHSSSVEICGRGKILINISIVKSFFNDILKGVQKHMTEIKRDLPHINTVFLVGGMAKSTYVREHINSVFGDCRVVVPEDPGVAVLKGAVLLGNRPQTIASRLARYTYGIAIKETFIPGVHREEYKVTRDGVELCDNVFEKLIEKGDVLQYGQRFTTTTFVTAKQPKRKQQTFTTYLYQSTKTSPMYVTDDGCSELGGFERHPPEGGWPDYCESKIELIVGEAELKLQVSDDLGRKYETNIDFLLFSE